jgi:t-SNARE complex subunit (syntaxin)
VACEADAGGAARAGAASRAGGGLKESLLEAGDAGEIGLALENAEARNVELRQLEADLGDLHTLFKDVATLASLQQEGLDSIESAVMEANVKVSSGVQELVKANRHQKAARKRMCCLVVTGAIVLFTVLYSLFN